jgi:hypothetical protein
MRLFQTTKPKKPKTNTEHSAREDSKVHCPVINHVALSVF